jgi:hypothetical protein
MIIAELLAKNKGDTRRAITTSFSFNFLFFKNKKSYTNPALNRRTLKLHLQKKCVTRKKMQLKKKCYCDGCDHKK